MLGSNAAMVEGGWSDVNSMGAPPLKPKALPLEDLAKKKKKKKAKKVDSDTIAKMRAILEGRIEDLEEFEEDASEDVKFELTMDQQRLDFKKDEAGKEDNIEYAYIYLTSASRDRAVFPNPGQYAVTFDSEVDNIVEASLVSASFPATEPSVNSSNFLIRYSFAPFNAPVTVQIPIGSYKGPDLAIELSTQLNISLFAGTIPAVNKIDENGLVYIVATGARPPLQFRVSFFEPQKKIVFQLIDSDENPSNTAFALHVEPLPASVQGPWSSLNTDIYSLIGFDRTLVASEGVYDPGSKTYYLVSTTNSANFGPGASQDMRFENSISGNRAADLRGQLLICIDIDRLNLNDSIIPLSGPENRFVVEDCFGYVVAGDPAEMKGNALEIINNAYPTASKWYRNGVSRVKKLLVTLRKPDGTIYTFGGLDHFMTIKIGLKRTQPDRPVFGR